MYVQHFRISACYCGSAADKHWSQVASRRPGPRAGSVVTLHCRDSKAAGTDGRAEGARRYGESPCARLEKIEIALVGMCGGIALRDRVF
jgi:hypothetical protein